MDEAPQIDQNPLYVAEILEEKNIQLLPLHCNLMYHKMRAMLLYSTNREYFCISVLIVTDMCYVK
jgi:hypothetical protein